MPPPFLIDLAAVDLSEVCLRREQIYEHLPHRHEFMLLDGVCHLDLKRHMVVAYRDIRDDDWWFRGHLPGRPLLPGVLMLEMAAHVCALAAKLTGAYEGFVGFGGVDRCKFRGPVTPPARLYLLSVAREFRARRIVSEAQGVAGGILVFEAQITGMTLR